MRPVVLRRRRHPLPSLEQGLALAAVAVAVAFLLWVAGKAGWVHISGYGLNFQRHRERTRQEMEWERQERQEKERADQRQLGVAFERYSEAAVGMVPMVIAQGPANEILAKWVDLVAGALDSALCRKVGDHFRVAVWADFGDAEAFKLLGSANHNRNDPRMERLSKDGTIAGHAWRSKAGEYLCADITKDRKYKARSRTPRPYKSIFAIRLGEPTHWGVMTIDAPTVESIGTTELAIIRRFAKLVSAGAAIAVARYAPRALPADSGYARAASAVERLPARTGTEEETSAQP